ncbi:MAG: GNAT family N-acetyltransferase [Alphaproteobacteria bacterium]|nr:GNAT family N-acetyltransferase [Alphaproteobacteria bacterium SS10]
MSDIGDPRPLTAEAAGEIAELLEEVAANDGQAVAGGWSADSLAKQLNAGHSQAWGHRGADGGALTSVILVQSVADRAEILLIATAANARRQGLGVALINHLATDAASKGCEQIMLEAAASNRAAIALYQRTGFTQTGLRPRYYGNEDAILMTRKIGGIVDQN